MNIGFFVNDVMTEQAGYTTVRLGMNVTNRGQKAWMIGATDFGNGIDGKLYANAATTPEQKTYATKEEYLAGLQGPKAIRERIMIDDLDVLMLRNDPSTETGYRTWAQTAGISFGRVAAGRGVVVVNDPKGLAMATNKMYFQLFPEAVRPKTLISQHRDDIRAFIKEMGGNTILKPLQGSGGAGVFIVRVDDRSNINQMIDTLTRDGYVIAQEYLPAAEEGDTRMFLMNGRPLRYKGKVAAFRRVRTGDDLRSNIHAGGKLRQAELTESHFRLAEIVRPKLVQDGMFLVGLDIVGDKLMEINVFSPGGLGSAQKFEKVDFSNAVIDALERKAAYMADYSRNFANVEMAML